MKTRIALIVLMCISTMSFAQNLKFYGLLPALSQTGRISKKVNYNLFVSTTVDAFPEKIGGIEYPATDFQLYVQPSIIYIYSPKVNFAGSYTYQRNNPFLGNFINEHRLWQQAIFSFALSKGRMTNRFRFEERFIENRITEKYPLFTRLRYQIGFNMPLQGKTLEKYEFYMNTYNEFYFSLTGAKNATYSENWTYLGFGEDFGNLGRIELGYVFQIAVRNQQKDLRFLNLAQITWITNFNVKKKSE